jgi:putative tricarboxylic transport membrane protein
MKKGEIWISLITIFSCLLFLWMLKDFPPALTEQDVGPALFPMIILSILLILSVTQLVITLRGISLPIKLIDHRLQVFACILLFLYIYLIPVLGYVLITPLFLIILTRLLNVRNWFVNISYSLVISGLIWCFFEKVSNVPLPGGILS